MHSDSSNSSGVRTKRSRRRLADDDSSSEGSVPPKPAAAASGSGSESSERDMDDQLSASSLDDGLNADLMGDSADRERLAKMTEKEREEELFKRAERREAMKARAMVKRKLMRKQRSGTVRSPSPPRRPSLSSSEEGEEQEEEVEEEDSDSISTRRPRQRRRDSKRQDTRNSQLAELMARRKALAQKSLLKTSDIYSEDSSSSSGESSAPAAAKNRRAFSSDSDDSSEIDEGRAAGSSTWLTQRQNELGLQKRPVKRFVDSSVSSELSDEDESERKVVEVKKKKKKKKTTGKKRKRLVMSSDEDGITRQEKVDDDASSLEEDEERQIETRHVECLDELLRIRVSRYRLAKWVHMPFFRDLVIGMFVRVGIGRQPDAGQPVYRLAEIADVVETSKIYDVEKTRTNKGLILRHASDKAMFRLKFVSNQPFGTTEFLKWQKSMQDSNMSTPTLRFIDEKVAAVKKAYQFRLENEKDLDKILAEKARFIRRPYNYAMHKVLLTKDKELAEQNADREKVLQLNEEIEECERRANEIDKRRSASIKALTYINQRNRERNLQNAEAALKMEAVETEEMERLHGGDPFTRQKTRPVLFAKRQKTGEGELLANTVAQKQQAQKEQGREKEERQKNAEEEEAAAVIRGGDFYSIHDFEVGVDIAMAPEETLTQPGVVPSPAVVAPSSEKKTEPKPRTLNLEEYKRRRNLL